MALTFNHYELSADGDEPVDVAIIGIPYDGGIDGPAVGQRNAPTAIRRVAEWQVLPGHTDSVVDVGDSEVFTDYGMSRDTAITNIYNTALRAKRVVILGGDNGISEWGLAAMHEAYDSPLNLVVFDAHWDLEESDVPSHATWLLDAINAGLVAEVHHLGHRAIEERPEVDVPFYDGWSVQAFQQHLPTYIAIDIDVLDPSVAPGTGVRVPAGRSMKGLVKRLDHYLRGYEVVGVDITEVCPAMDHCDVTSLNASYLLLRTLVVDTLA
jgi:agmatinase